MGASQWDMVNFNKNKVWNICVTLIATGFHHYLNFFQLAHDAFCKQTLHFFTQQFGGKGRWKCIVSSSFILKINVSVSVDDIILILYVQHGTAWLLVGSYMYIPAKSIESHVLRVLHNAT